MKSKAIIAALGIITLSVWADVISASIHENRLNVPVEYSSRLVVNKINSKRYIVNKGEKEGIKDIGYLVKTSKYEESWAYLPTKKQWVEVGLDECVRLQESSKPFFSYLSIDTLFDMIGLNTGLESAKETSTGLMLDTKNLENLMKENNNLVLYHFHPKDEVCIYPAAHAMPSPQDLISMIGQTNKYLKYQPKGSITFKVCSPSGIVEYCLTEKGKTQFHDKDISYIEDQSKKAFENITPQLAISFGSNIKNKAPAAKTITIDLFTIRFMPY